MGFFSKLFGNKFTKNKEELSKNTSSENIIDTMLTVAEVAMNKEDYEMAIKTYKDILKLDPNATAQCILGSLYAQGKGVEQNFMEGAYFFHQAELNGDEQSENLCLKCSMDFVHSNEEKSSKQIYSEMIKFIHYVYPEMTDINIEVCRRLYAIAGHHFNKQEYAPAAKLFRAAGEFGNDGYSQNYLAVLYNLGLGIEQNDLAALYWFDKAIDNGAADVAQRDRDGILNAYKENFPPEEFSEIILRLAEWCETGSEDVPKDIDKSIYWRKINENRE